MNQTHWRRSRFLSGLGVVCAAVCLAGCLQIPVTIEITVPIYDNYYVPIPPVWGPGTPIPDKYTKYDIPVCEIPTEAEIRAQLEEKLGSLGSLISQSYTIDLFELVESRMTATQGDFTSLTSVALTFKPKPIDGVPPQPPLDLGAISSPSGLGAEIVLTPPVPVDLLMIMNDEAASTGAECAHVGAEVHGAVPAGTVSASVSVRARIGVTAKGLLPALLVRLLPLLAS